MGFRDYQKIYDIKKAEKLLDKHGILDPKQKKNNNDKIKEEKNKPKKDKK